MSNKLLTEASKTLQEIRMQRDFQLKRISELDIYKDCMLVTSSGRAGQIYHYAKIKGSSNRQYLGDDSNETVQRVKEYRHLKQAVEDADLDIALIEDLLKNFLPLDRESVDMRLPKVYRNAALTAGNAVKRSRGNMTDKEGKRSATTPGMDPRAAAWKKRMEAHKAKFPVKHPEELKEPCLDGTMVRSKSEMIIANILIMAGIPYVYEYPYNLGGIDYYMDFTILSTLDYETEIIIEHQGMMDLDWYKGKYMGTLNACLREGLVPNVDIFFTFDSDDNVFDSSQVLEVLRGRIFEVPDYKADTLTGSGRSPSGRSRR